MGPCDENEGKLYCTCGTLVGGFMWSGDQCSCGAWVTPALKVGVAKVDREVVRPAQTQTSINSQTA